MSVHVFRYVCVYVPVGKIFSSLDGGWWDGCGGGGERMICMMHTV